MLHLSSFRYQSSGLWVRSTLLYYNVLVTPTTTSLSRRIYLRARFVSRSCPSCVIRGLAKTPSTRPRHRRHQIKDAGRGPHTACLSSSPPHRRMWSMILCSPSPGVEASEMMTRSEGCRATAFAAHVLQYDASESMNGVPGVIALWSHLCLLDGLCPCLFSNKPMARSLSSASRALQNLRSRC